MLTRLTYSLVIRITLIAGTSLAALLLYLAPTLPVWEDKRLFHEGPKTLSLPSGDSVEQTFVFTHDKLDRVVIWLDTSKPLPKKGSIRIDVKTVSSAASATLPLVNIPPGGTTIFPLDPPLPAAANNEASFSLKLTGPKQRVHLKYQIDATKYEAGKLVYHPNLRKKGDLAFQLRYQRPALFYRSLQIAYPLLIFIAGIFVSLMIKPSTAKPKQLTRINKGKKVKNLLPPALLFLIITSFYGLILIKPGTWVGPSDFSKELSYVISSSEAFKSLSWPIWSHYTCGGMPLLGNPEGTALSLSTLLAIITSRPELALWLAISIEAGIAAFGVYCLARALKLSATGSIFASIVVALSATYIYKIVEGIVMVGGPFAFFPWALLGLHKSLKKRSPGWLFLSSLSLIAMFWRGDVHIIFGIIITMFIWTTFFAIKKRRLSPVLTLFAILALFAVGASVKTLPYFEQPTLISSKVDPHSAQITKLKLWDDIFLKTHERTYKIPVLHGLPEHYGYIGSYVGIIPIILAVYGLFTRHKYRWHIIISLVVSLLIVDGALYENVLRHIGPLSALFRMPTRLLFISTLFIALLSGIGIDRINKKYNNPSSKQIYIYKYLPITLIVIAAFNLILANLNIVQESMSPYSKTSLEKPSAPLLVPHLNQSPDNKLHASILLKHGYLLPHVCGDQNNPAEFISTMDTPTQLSDYTTALQPNNISLSNLPGNADISVRERFVSAWYPSSGQIIPASNGSIHLITAAGPQNSVSITYISATKRAQQVLLLTIIALAALSIVNTLYFNSGRKR